MTVGNAVDARTARVQEIALAHRARRGPLLPVLHEINDELGHVDQDDIAVVADALNLAVAEVHGVVPSSRASRRAPAGRATLRICRAEACQSVGADALAEHARTGLGVGFGETT